MSHWRNVDHSEKLGFSQFWPKQMSQIEVPKMVNSILHFESIRGESPLRNGHGSCSVDKKINFVTVKRLCKFPNTLQIAKIKFELFC